MAHSRVRFPIRSRVRFPLRSRPRSLADAEEAIAGLDPAEYGSWDTFYIVTEYDPANATETGWYVKHGEAKAGLITDFRMRVHPELYPRHHLPFVQMLRIQFFTIPPVSHCYCRRWLVGLGWLGWVG